MRGGVLALALTMGLLAAPGAAPAQEVLEKRVFEGGAYQTRGGGTIGNLRIGYQTMGRLNAEGTNAILICHFFSGNSHAFGRLSATGPAGYWDAIIGPGKPIDTDKYFVVSADTLVNVNVPDANTVTTGPASINPDTGRPYAMTFPVVSMRDFVETQKRLLDSLGVKRLALVAGPSNGGLQSIEWAAAYPGFVERVMPVIAAEIDAWMQGWLDLWESPIRLDPIGGTATTTRRGGTCRSAAWRRPGRSSPCRRGTGSGRSSTTAAPPMGRIRPGGSATGSPSNPGSMRRRWPGRGPRMPMPSSTWSGPTSCS
ncbi:hypothetical protein ACFQY5_06795 [Paeniroseomonas aquatica]|uniref:hypothetical protein n=1 Tax=Paeniroseomonas aquatica TaxID=373043 RepID=UPI00361DA553